MTHHDTTQDNFGIQGNENGPDTLLISDINHIPNFAKTKQQDLAGTKIPNFLILFLYSKVLDLQFESSNDK